jgi:hypothetical protein
MIVEWIVQRLHPVRPTTEFNHSASAGYKPAIDIEKLADNTTTAIPSVRIPSHEPDIEAPCQPFLFEENVTYSGPDLLYGRLDKPVADAVACCRLCTATEPCTHWTHLNGVCQIKHGQLRVAKATLPHRVSSGRVALDLRVPRLATPVAPTKEAARALGPSRLRAAAAAFRAGKARAKCSWDPLDRAVLSSGAAK